MCSLQLYLVIFGTALSVSWAKSVEDELTVTYRLVTFNYSTASNEVHAGQEVCRQELLSNMTKKYLMYMDKTVDPCDNFYKYACGNFGKFHPIPDVRSASFIDDLLEKRMNNIISEFLKQPLAENYDLNSAETKARIFYKACSDNDTIRQRGIEPLKEFIASLGGWAVFNQTSEEDSFDLIKVLRKLSHLNVHIVLGVGVDFSTMRDVNDVVSIFSGDTFLSKRKCSNSSDLAKLKKFFEDVLLLSGVPSGIANETSEEAAIFELQITKLQFDPHSSERVENLTFEELQSQIPGINWSRLMSALFNHKLDPEQKLRLWDREYIEGLSNLLQETPKRTLANYVFLKVLILFSPLVAAGFKNIDNDFKNLTNAEISEVECEIATRAYFRDVIYAYFAKNYVKDSTKSELKILAELLKKSFAKTIEENGWLDSKTKAVLRKVLSGMVLRFGLLENKLSESNINKKYMNIKVSPDKFFESFLSIVEQGTVDQFKLLNKTSKHYSWEMEITRPGAVYDRIKNTAFTMIPLLQPPYYHTHFPKAINFGAMGSLLGHEIAHAFDNNGTWTQDDVTVYSNWTKNSMRTFDSLAECFLHQFDSYSTSNMSLNGTATLGENIADTTGLQMSYRAYLEELTQRPSEDNQTLPKLNMTDKQLFFLSFAHSWCSASSQTSLNRTIQRDSHSPPEFRVIGTLSNTKEFAETFSCPIGSNMNPLNKCSIW